MITVLPVDQPAPDIMQLVGNALGTVFEVREQGRLLGAMTLHPEPELLRVTAFVLFGLEQQEGQAFCDWDVAELMLRAAASYGKNRMIWRLVCGNTFPQPLAKRFNFVQIAEEWYLDIHCFLSGCKNYEKT